MNAGRAAPLLLLPALLMADFDAARWRYRAPLTVAGAAGGPAAARIEDAIWVAARSDLGDLRLVAGRAEWPYVIERGPAWQVIAAPAPARSEDSATSSTVLVLDLGARLPSARLRLETSVPSFWRAADLETSVDRSRWNAVANGAFYRLPGEESLVLAYPEQHARFLRIHVRNRDDRPLEISGVFVEAPETRLEFVSARAPLWLYLGNPDAHPPSYDLGRILPRQAAAVAPASIGALQANPAYRPPTPPWTERHPEILYATLAAAIAALAWLIARFWLKLPPRA